MNSNEIEITTNEVDSNASNISVTFVGTSYSYTCYVDGVKKTIGSSSQTISVSGGMSNFAILDSSSFNVSSWQVEFRDATYTQQYRTLSATNGKHIGYLGVDGTWKDVKVRIIGTAITKYTITVATDPVDGSMGKFDWSITNPSHSGSGSMYISQQAVKGAAVSLTAKPNTTKGYDFAGWYSGSVVVRPSLDYSFTANANRNLTAKFKSYSLYVDGGGSNTEQIWFDDHSGSGRKTFSGSTLTIYGGRSEKVTVGILPENHNKEWDDSATVKYTTSGGTLTKYSDSQVVKHTSRTHTPNKTEQTVTIGVGKVSFWWNNPTEISTTTALKPTLPDGERVGYKGDYFSYNGTNVGSFGKTCTKQITDPGTYTFSAVWKPYTYNFAYDLNGGKDTTSTLKKFTKTYGENKAMKEFGFTTAPVKGSDNAYTFSHWDSPLGNKYPLPTTILGDADYPGNDNTKSTVTLTANYVLNPNEIHLYYLTDKVDYTRNYETRKYTYEDASSLTGYVVKNPNWEDHAFVGWTKTKPSKWVYDSIDEVNKEKLNPLSKLIRTTKNAPTPWGDASKIETFYGVWIRSGKKVKIIDPSTGEPMWKDIFATYVKLKTDTGEEWKQITEILSKTDKGWKHESGWK